MFARIVRFSCWLAELAEVGVAGLMPERLARRLHQ
jgi:hypothetical protein